MRRLLLPVMATAWLAGCPQGERVQLTDPNTGGKYYLFLPEAGQAGGPLPVIVTCHGTDPFDTARIHYGEWRWLAEKYRCVLVCPILTSSDAFDREARLAKLFRDEKLIMSILDRLARRHDIDRKNTMITGFSGGGFPTYFVGLRHPDVFSVVVGRKCNFNRRAIDGWYPPEAVGTALMICYGENDPGTIRSQSENGIRYFRSKGFNLTTALVPGAGLERTPEYAMKFFLENWNGTPPPFKPPPNSKVSGRLRRRYPRR